MKIDKKTWILVGIFFWGVPTSALTALIMTLNRSMVVTDAVRFDIKLFLSNFAVMAPLFALLGLIAGLIIHKLSTNIIHGHKLSQGQDFTVGSS